MKFATAGYKWRPTPQVRLARQQRVKQYRDQLVAEGKCMYNCGNPIVADRRTCEDCNKFLHTKRTETRQQRKAEQNGSQAA